MDVVSESGTLLIGTNTHAILTHSIADLINFIPEDQESINQLGYDMSNFDDDEEYKTEYDDYGNEMPRHHRQYNNDDEEDDFDYNGDNLVIQNVMEMNKLQKQIMEADKEGTSAKLNL